MDLPYAARYRELHERHWWWRAREALVLGVLEAHRPAGGFGAILDVGCGDGLFFDALRVHGVPEGVEVDAGLVTELGRSRGTIHQVPFLEFRPARKFGLVLMLDSLEHMEDGHAALAHALELLEPGGKLVVTVPAFRELWTSHDDLNHHVERYTRSTFLDLARAAGMRTDELRYFFHWMYPLKRAVHVKEKLLGAHPRVPGIPPAPINAALRVLSRLEARLLGSAPLPVGSSLLAVGGRA